MSQKQIFALVGVLCTILVALIAVFILTMPKNEQRLANQTVSAVKIGGAYTLVNGQGQTVSNEDFEGKYQLVLFGFTFCPDVCPTGLSTMALALDELGDKADKINPLFITIDPKRDTYDILDLYTQQFSDRIIGLTGSQGQIDQVAQAYKVYYAIPPEQDAEDYVVDHSAYIYLMAPDGSYIDLFHHDQDFEEIAAKLNSYIQ